MHLKGNWRVGLVRPVHFVDQILKSQGFITSHSHPPTYVIWMEDAATGAMYRMRIPTDIIEEEEKPREANLRLGLPVIERPGRSGPSQYIPRSIQYAAKHKLAEITSYLQTMPSSTSVK